jgi:hypothetical protein
MIRAAGVEGKSAVPSSWNSAAASVRGTWVLHAALRHASPLNRYHRVPPAGVHRLKLQWDGLADDLRTHGRILQLLGLTPRDLRLRPRGRVAVRWTLVNLLFFGVTLPLAALGTLIFWAPWKLVRAAEPRFRLPLDRQATYRVLATVVAGGGWVLFLATLALELHGWRSAVAVLLVFPLTGILTLRIRTWWRSAVADLRRFLFLRGQHAIRGELLETQGRLAWTIRALQLRL